MSEATPKVDKPKDDKPKADDHGSGHGGGSKLGTAWGIGILLIVLMMTGVLPQLISLVLYFLGTIIGFFKTNLGIVLGGTALFIWYKTRQH